MITTEIPSPIDWLNSEPADRTYWDSNLVRDETWKRSLADPGLRCFSDSELHARIIADAAVIKRCAVKRGTPVEVTRSEAEQMARDDGCDRIEIWGIDPQMRKSVIVEHWSLK